LLATAKSSTQRPQKLDASPSDIEIILFGDDAGAAEISRELGLRHEPHVERNEFGTKRVDYIFSSRTSSSLATTFSATAIAT